MSGINFSHGDSKIYKIPEDVCIENIVYRANCYSWIFTNKAAYHHRHYLITFLFHNIMKSCGGGPTQLQVEFKEGKILINSREFGITASLDMKDLPRFTTLIREAFISQGFLILWSIRPFTHHSQIIEVQNKAEKCLEALQLAWPPMRSFLINYNPSTPATTFPDKNAPINAIRKFFDNSKNAIYFNNVKILFLNNLGLTEFPFGINRFQDLEGLRLTDNALTTIPDLAFSKLKDLYLTNNPLKTFSPNLQCPKLQILNIAKCQLENFFSNLNNCTSLKVLNLTDNKLKKLSIDFKNCKNLEGLYAPSNQLELFSSDISECTNLVYLDLNNNKLQYFTTNLNHCSSLLLDLANNRLQTFYLSLIVNCKKINYVLDPNVTLIKPT